MKNSSKDNGEIFFGKKDTNTVKGIAILMMLAHHLFTESNVENWDVATLLLTSRPMLVRISATFKVCVSLFVFLTSFGMTRKYSALKTKGRLCAQSLTSITLRRYIRLITGFWFVYLLVFVARVIQTPLSQIYGADAPQCVIQIILDLLGLQYLFGTATLNATWWYLTLAQILLFVLPLMFLLYQKIGLLILPISLLLPMITVQVDYFQFYAFVAAVGMVCAETDFIERITPPPRGGICVWLCCRSCYVRCST